MHLHFQNVNDAFYGLIAGMADGRIETEQLPSRNGPVMQVIEPVCVTYSQPRERVLLNSARDANPFFHLFESLWMLAGRNDVAALKYYASTIGNFSDNGETFNGAYGHRWRQYEILTGDAPISYRDVDQLKIIIDHLKRNPSSRRVVLSMWNVEDDLLKIDTSKDVACNTQVYFSVRRGQCPTCEGQGKVETTDNNNDRYRTYDQCERCKGFPESMPRWLDMTVTNRSNDLIWGMLGANVVHFSFLQEYLANAIGLEVGVYHQFTNNLHVYTETNSGWHPEKWTSQSVEDYPSGSNLVDLVKNVEVFDREVKEFVRLNSVDVEDIHGQIHWTEPFLDFVAQPMMHAFHMHKQRDYEAALNWLDKVQDEAWVQAAYKWLIIRRNNFQKGKVEG